MTYKHVVNGENFQFNQFLYNSFCDQPKSWVMRNYKVNHADKSMSPGVQYYDQQSYLLKMSGQVVSGLTFNFNNKAEYQLEKMGFSIPGWEKQNSCEILHFFVMDVPRRNSFHIGKAILKLEKEILSKKHLQTIFATCAARILPIYCRFGWELIDEITLEKNKKLFLIQYSH